MTPNGPCFQFNLVTFHRLMRSLWTTHTLVWHFPKTTGNETKTGCKIQLLKNSEITENSIQRRKNTLCILLFCYTHTRLNRKSTTLCLRRRNRSKFSTWAITISLHQFKNPQSLEKTSILLKCYAPVLLSLKHIQINVSMWHIHNLQNITSIWTEAADADDPHRGH